MRAGMNMTTVPHRQEQFDALMVTSTQQLTSHLDEDVGKGNEHNESDVCDRGPNQQCWPEPLHLHITSHRDVNM